MAADEEHLVSMVKYGIILIRGFGIQKNKKGGEKYIRKAIDKGNSDDMKTYGCLKNNKIIFDSEEIIEFIDNLAEIENLESYLISGLQKNVKNDAFYDFSVINYIIKTKINQGNTDALLIFGLMLWNGFGIKIDKKKAIQYFEAAAEKGNEMSMLKCANLYTTGIEVERDLSKALKYLKKAANKLAINDKSLLSNVSELEESFYYVLAEHNDLNKTAIALASLFIAEQENKNTEKFQYHSEIASLYSKVLSAYCYSNMLYFGTGTPVNKKESIKYLTLAINFGHPQSMLQYGNMLISGDEIEGNILEGLKYLKKAADKECLDAMYRYGTLLYEGKICPQNKEEGEKYIIKAKEENHFKSLLYYYETVKNDQKGKIEIIKKGM